MTMSQPWLAAGGGAVGPLHDDEACFLLMWCWGPAPSPDADSTRGPESCIGCTLVVSLASMDTIECCQIRYLTRHQWLLTCT